MVIFMDEQKKHGVNSSSKKSRMGKLALGLVGLGTLASLTYYTLTSSPKIEQKTSMMDTIDIKMTHPETLAGRYKRVVRWEDVLDSVETTYDVQEGLLPALAMQESCGDPLKVEKTGDGGAGLFMFQPGTAKGYDLQIFGNSNATGKDHKHGKKLKELLKKTHYDMIKMASYDDRFDLKKATDAAARFLKDLYKRNHTWTKSLYSYNRGHCSVSNAHAANYFHVKSIRLFQELWLEEKQLHGKDVDTSLLRQLRSMNAFDGELLKAEDGRDSLTTDSLNIFKYVVNEGDFSKDYLAKKFEVWDNYQNNNSFGKVNYARGIRKNPQKQGLSNYSFKPGKTVYLVAKRTKKMN